MHIFRLILRIPLCLTMACPKVWARPPSPLETLQAAFVESRLLGPKKFQSINDWLRSLPDSERVEIEKNFSLEELSKPLPELEIQPMNTPDHFKLVWTQGARTDVWEIVLNDDGESKGRVKIQGQWRKLEELPTRASDWLQTLKRDDSFEALVQFLDLDFERYSRMSPLERAMHLGHLAFAFHRAVEVLNEDQVNVASSEEMWQKFNETWAILVGAKTWARQKRAAKAPQCDKELAVKCVNWGYISEYNKNEDCSAEKIDDFLMEHNPIFQDNVKECGKQGIPCNPITVGYEKQSDGSYKPFCAPKNNHATDNCKNKKMKSRADFKDYVFSILAKDGSNLGEERKNRLSEFVKGDKFINEEKYKAVRDIVIEPMKKHIEKAIEACEAKKADCKPKGPGQKSACKALRELLGDVRGLEDEVEKEVKEAAAAAVIPNMGPIPAPSVPVGALATPPPIPPKLSVPAGPPSVQTPGRIAGAGSGAADGVAGKPRPDAPSPQGQMPTVSATTDPPSVAPPTARPSGAQVPPGGDHGLPPRARRPPAPAALPAMRGAVDPPPPLKPPAVTIPTPPVLLPPGPASTRGDRLAIAAGTPPPVPPADVPAHEGAPIPAVVAAPPPPQPPPPPARPPAPAPTAAPPPAEVESAAAAPDVKKGDKSESTFATLLPTGGSSLPGIGPFWPSVLGGTALACFLLPNTPCNKPNPFVGGPPSPPPNPSTSVAPKPKGEGATGVNQSLKSGGTRAQP